MQVRAVRGGQGTVRVLSAAVFTPALALPAHHLGGAPTAGSLLVLVATGLTVLTLGAALRHPLGGRHGAAALTGLLAVGQVGAHLALGATMAHGATSTATSTVSMGAMDHAAMDHAAMDHAAMDLAAMAAVHGTSWVFGSPSMLLAHVAAVALAVALVTGADRVAPLCAQGLRRLVPIARGLVPRTPSRTPALVATTPAGLRPRVVTTQVLRRGPPVRA